MADWHDNPNEQLCLTSASAALMHAFVSTVYSVACHCKNTCHLPQRSQSQAQLTLPLHAGLTQLSSQEQLSAQVEEAIDELVDAHRQQLGLTFGQTDAVHSLQGPKKVKRLAGMVQVAPSALLWVQASGFRV